MSWSKRRGKVCSASEICGGAMPCRYRLEGKLAPVALTNSSAEKCSTSFSTDIAVLPSLTKGEPARPIGLSDPTCPFHASPLGPRPTTPRPIRSAWRATWPSCSTSCGPWLTSTPSCTRTGRDSRRMWTGWPLSWSRRGGG